jgi:hypothetical protein
VFRAVLVDSLPVRLHDDVLCVSVLYTVAFAAASRAASCRFKELTHSAIVLSSLRVVRQLVRGAGHVGSVEFTNNNDCTVAIDRFNSVASAPELPTRGNQTAVAVRSESPNAWGLSCYTAAARHAPLHGGGLQRKHGL